MKTITQPAGKFQGFDLPISNFTQVPDELLDHLPVLTGGQLKALLFIFRKTKGYQKEWDKISLSQFVQGTQKKDGTWADEGTGLSKAQVCRVLKQLEKLGFILVRRKTTKITLYSLATKPRKRTTEELVPKMRQALVPKMRHTIYNKQNTRLTPIEEKLLKFLESEETIRRPEAFIATIKSRYGTKYLPKLMTVDVNRWYEFLDHWKKLDAEGAEIVKAGI